jgi:DNA-binding response OmpR family regulator
VFKGLEIDLHGRLVLGEGEPVEPTAKEFDLLSLLAAHPERVYTSEQIMRHLWDEEFFGEPRAPDVLGASRPVFQRHHAGPRYRPATDRLETSP